MIQEKQQSHGPKQLVLERQLMIKRPGPTCSYDLDATTFLIKGNTWRNVFNSREAYKMFDLLQQGYVIKSLTKSFVDGSLGYETAILEKE